MALAAVILLSAAPLHPAAAKGKAVPSFFNSKETRSKNLKPFKKWTSAIKRYNKEDKVKDGKCDAKKMNKCHYAKWMKFLAKIKDKKRLTPGQGGQQVHEPGQVHHRQEQLGQEGLLGINRPVHGPLRRLRGLCHCQVPVPEKARFHQPNRCAWWRSKTST